MRVGVLAAIGGCAVGCLPLPTGDDAAITSDIAPSDAPPDEAEDAPLSARPSHPIVVWNHLGAAFDGGLSAHPRDASTPDAAPPVDVGPTPVVTPAPSTPDLSATGTLRLIAPLSTSVVTSRRPTLRWGPMPEGAQAHISLCDDPACARVLAELDATGSTARPAAALRPGPVFWRAHIKPTTGAEWESPTWEFFVTPHDAAIDTARCCVVDVNRDGVPDIESRDLDGRGSLPTNRRWVAQMWNRGVYVSEGAGYRSAPWIAEVPTLSRRVGGCDSDVHTGILGVRYVGDTDGDGFGDVGLGLGQSVSCGGNPGVTWGYATDIIVRAAGGATGLVTETAGEIRSPIDWDFYRSFSIATIDAAGDSDGDGYGDVAWAARYPSYRYHGLFPSREGRFGGQVSYASPDDTRGYGEDIYGLDVDGDGRADRAAFDPLESSTRLVVATATDTRSWALPQSLEASRGFERIGDLDGDGDEELAVWFINARTFVSYSVILLGGPEGYSFARTIPYDLATVDGTGGPLFDVNGDGRSDRLVFPNGVPAALYFGSPTGFTFAAALPRCTRTSRVCGPYWHFSAGDFNRDGFSDLYVWSDDTHRFEIFAGGPTGFGAEPIFTSNPPS